MPRAFMRCYKNGGKIRTISGPDKKHGLKAGQYVQYCTLSGWAYRGHVKQKGK